MPEAVTETLEGGVSFDTANLGEFKPLADSASWCYMQIIEHTPHRFWRLDFQCTPISEDDYVMWKRTHSAKVDA